MGGRFHPRLNINTRPIANKYHEGKVKRTLKRGLKVHETVKGEANAAVVFMLAWFALRVNVEHHHVGISSISCLVENQFAVSSHSRVK